MPDPATEETLLSIAHRYKLPPGFWDYLYILLFPRELIEFLNIFYHQQLPDVLKKPLFFDNSFLLFKIRLRDWKSMLEVMYRGLNKRRRRKLHKYSVELQKIIKTYRFSNTFNAYTQFYRSYADVVLYFKPDERGVFSLLQDYHGELINIGQGYLYILNYYHFLSLYRQGRLREWLKGIPEQSLLLLDAIAGQSNLSPEEIFKLHLDEEFRAKVKKFFKLKKVEPTPTLIEWYLQIKHLGDTLREQREVFRKLYQPNEKGWKFKRFGKKYRKNIMQWYPPFRLQKLSEWWQEFIETQEGKEKAQLIEQLREIFESLEESGAVRVVES